MPDRDDDKPDLGALLRLALGDMGKPKKAAPDPDDDDFLSPGRLAAGVWDRLALLERERVEAVFLAEELRPLAPETRLARIQGDARFRTWGVVESLLAESREEAETDPDAALSLAQLAFSAAELLAPKTYGGSCVEDLCARCLGVIGHSYCRRGALAEAEETLEAAWDHLGDGTGDVLEKAQLLDLEASLRTSQRRFSEALAAIDRSIRSFRAARDQHFAGLAMLRRASILRAADRRGEAVAVAREALSMIETERVPREVLEARRALICDLETLGRAEEAKAEAARPPALPVRWPEALQ